MRCYFIFAIVCLSIYVELRFDMSSSLLYLEVEEYARAKLGIDPETEPHLLDIARQGLTAKLPEPWKPWYVLLFSVLRFF